MFGRPGIVLPVTKAEAESLPATGSTGLLELRVAVFRTAVVPVTLTVIWSDAVAPFARTPMFHTPDPVA